MAQDLKDTLDAHRNGCVGMAANMIGVPKRIIAFVDEDSAAAFRDVQSTHHRRRRRVRYGGRLPLAPGRARTVRYQRIEVDYMDRKFRERHAASPVHRATIIQHEIDHCDGVII